MPDPQFLEHRYWEQLELGRRRTESTGRSPGRRRAREVPAGSGSMCPPIMNILPWATATPLSKRAMEDGAADR